MSNEKDAYGWVDAIRVLNTDTSQAGDTHPQTAVEEATQEILGMSDEKIKEMADDPENEGMFFTLAKNFDDGFDSQGHEEKHSRWVKIAVGKWGCNAVLDYEKGISYFALEMLEEDMKENNVDLGEVGVYTFNINVDCESDYYGDYDCCLEYEKIED